MHCIRFSCTHLLTIQNENINTDLSLLVTTQLEVLASLDGQHSLGSAVGLHTLKPQDNLLCGLSLEKEKPVRCSL